MPTARTLFVYEKALEACAACERVSREIGPTRPDLADQLRRASASVALNIAEGAGEFAPKEKARFYRIARRSASECVAIFDVVERVMSRRPSDRAARELLHSVSALLTITIKAVESRAP